MEALGPGDRDGRGSARAQWRPLLCSIGAQAFIEHLLCVRPGARLGLGKVRHCSGFQRAHCGGCCFCSSRLHASWLLTSHHGETPANPLCGLRHVAADGGLTWARCFLLGSSHSCPPLEKAPMPTLSRSSCLLFPFLASLPLFSSLASLSSSLAITVFS